MNVVNLSIKDLKCDRVTVYQQEAEITRLIEKQIPKGDTRIIINSVNSCIDLDSIRIDSTSEVMLLDVSSRNETKTNDDLNNLEQEINLLESELIKVKLKLDTVNTKIENFNLFFKNLTRQPQADSFISFMDEYSNKLEALIEQKNQIEENLKSLNEDLRQKKQDFSAILLNINHQDTICITIDVWSAKGVLATLSMSYFVTNASWYPKYDIRAFSEQNNFTINYFGMITQTTGEDWNEAEIVLSTDKPFVGPSAPELETQKVRSRPSVHVPLIAQARKPSSQANLTSLRRGSEMVQTELGLIQPHLNDDEAKINSIGVTSSFEIEGKNTIECNGKPHKVLIAVISLKPEFLYEVCPRKNKNAYIKAKVKNNSDYELISGAANIYLNNNFISKTELKSYYPCEEFICSLGIDKSIEIDYRPGKIFTHQTGLINKIITSTHVQVIIIEIKNNSANRARILLVENLPLSVDEKVQVKLLEPLLTRNQSNIRLNRHNNLEFELDLAAFKTEEVVIKYTIEGPSTSEIEFL